MTPDRIRELAEQAAKETAIEFTDRARAQPDAIERAIRAALVESWGEEPTPEMREAFMYWACEGKFDEGYKAAMLYKRREFEGQG